MTVLTGNLLQTTAAEMTRDMQGGHLAWTESKKAKLVRDSEWNFPVTSYLETNRMKCMAGSRCLICKLEGVESLNLGQPLTIQFMIPISARLHTTDTI
jgi:hypothetical protein